MLNPIAGFDWDDGNRLKCQKHDVTIAEIEAVLQGTLWVFPDVAHSTAETRYLGIGRTEAGRYVFIAYTLRSTGDTTRIRPVSARFMHEKEIKHFEAQI
jgi:uncharacterized DUF497 family protein